MKILITFFIFSLNFIFSFGQSNCENCKEFFKKREFENAKVECLKASEDGDPICQAYLGIIYLSESNTNNARIWFEKSASQGNPIGQNGLGYLYQNGLGGLSKSIEKANEWFLKSAEQGNSDSQFWLGENLFLSGNKTEGFNWTQKASLNGSSGGQFNLAAMLYNGEGTEKNETLAIIWFIISATNGNEKARNFVDDLKIKLSEEEFQNFLNIAQEFVDKNPNVLE